MMTCNALIKDKNVLHWGRECKHYTSLNSLNQTLFSPRLHYRSSCFKKLQTCTLQSNFDQKPCIGCSLWQWSVTFSFLWAFLFTPWFFSGKLEWFRSTQEGPGKRSLNLSDWKNWESFSLEKRRNRTVLWKALQKKVKPCSLLFQSARLIQESYPKGVMW